MCSMLCFVCRLGVSNILFQRYATYMNVLIKKDGGITFEDFARLGGKELACTLFGAKAVHLRMTLHVVYKALAYVFSLFDYLDIRRSILTDFIIEDGVMGATKNNGIYLIVLG